MWEVPLETHKSEVVSNKFMDHTTKSKLAQRLHATILTPEKTILVKAIKLGLLNTWPGLTAGLINKHMGK